MTQVISKLAPISATCMEHVHPWTNSCTIASAGLLFQAVPESFRIYAAVYLFSLAMRGKIPTKSELKRTVMGILQSTLFLTTNAYTFSAFVCLLRRLLGRFYFPSVTFIPSFLASLCAILLERPSRRNLLTFYVANVATESYWRMLVSRGIVKSIPLGQVIIFSVSSAICALFYRNGYHLKQKDNFFSSLRFVIGNNEESNYDASAAGQLRQDRGREMQTTSSTRTGIWAIDQVLRVYNDAVNKLKSYRHASCPHNCGCLKYISSGGLKLYVVGISIQLTLSVLFQIQKILRRPATLKDIFLAKDFSKIAFFLGGYCALFRAVSCILRHARGKDAPEHAVPAGLIAGAAFSSYPNVSIALYTFWKTLQFVYAYGNERGYLPNVPGFGMLLYCTFTATLFHVAMFEPKNLRGSYFKFLDRLSGGRIAFMSRIPLDIWGLQSTKQLQTVLAKSNIRTDLKFLF